MENKNCILVVSYIEHRKYLDRFIYSIKANTHNNVKIYILVSKKEAEFFDIIKDDNMTIVIMSEMMREICGIEMNEEEELNRIGKYNYQSMKKFYGLYYLFVREYDNVVVYDSESIVIRDIDINEMINKYVESPFIIYSDTERYGNKVINDLHEKVIKTTNMILNIEGRVNWYLEYYNWIYEKKIFVDFMSYIIRENRMSIMDIFREDTTIFIEEIYYAYIYAKNEYGYKFVEVYKEIEESGGEINKIEDKIGQLKPLEDSRKLVEEQEEYLIGKIYRKLGLNIYKTYDTYKSLNFVINTEDIKICVSEYSDKIYNEFVKGYKDSKIEEIIFIDKYMKKVSGGYIIQKSTSESEMYKWIGYKMRVSEDTCIRFNFEMKINYIANDTNKNEIGFKKHMPDKKINIDYKKMVHKNWEKMEVIMTARKNMEELYVLIFDDAPTCEIEIRNMTYTQI